MATKVKRKRKIEAATRWVQCLGCRKPVEAGGLAYRLLSYIYDEETVLAAYHLACITVVDGEDA